MHTDPAHGQVRHHKNRHLAEKTEGAIGMIMLIAVILLGLAMVWLIVSTGDTTPKWMQ